MRGDAPTRAVGLTRDSAYEYVLPNGDRWLAVRDSPGDGWAVYRHPTNQVRELEQ